MQNIFILKLLNTLTDVKSFDATQKSFADGEASSLAPHPNTAPPSRGPPRRAFPQPSSSTPASSSTPSCKQLLSGRDPPSLRARATDGLHLLCALRPRSRASRLFHAVVQAGSSTPAPAQPTASISSELFHAVVQAGSSTPSCKQLLSGRAPLPLRARATDSLHLLCALCPRSRRPSYYLLLRGASSVQAGSFGGCRDAAIADVLSSVVCSNASIAHK
jgi:hypothetical protein